MPKQIDEDLLIKAAAEVLPNVGTPERALLRSQGERVLLQALYIAGIRESQNCFRSTKKIICSTLW